MDPFQIAIIALVGGVASHLYAKHKTAQLRRHMIYRHVTSMTALADAAIEILAVDYNVPVQEALNKLQAKATELNPNLLGVDKAQVRPDAQERIDKLRKEKHGSTRPD